MSDGQFVIVGGSKGIGLGIVQRLVQQGHEVTVLSRSLGFIGTLANVTHHVFDVTKDDITDAMLPEKINGFAYCPGSINLRSFRSLKPAVFRDDFELNVIGAVRTLQAAMPRFPQESGSASVVLFSTVAVAQGMFAHASIAASKGAIEGITLTLAVELAPKVRVNCIAPALTDTAMTEKFFADPEKAKSLAEKYPLARTGTVDDIASLAHFLLTPISGWITGQVIGVDGGMSTLRK